MPKKQSKIKVKAISPNHRQADYIDMEDNIKCSHGEDRIVMFKGVLLEQFLVMAKDQAKSTTRYMAKIVKANKMWRYFCKKYPIYEGSEEHELSDGSVAVECDYIDSDMYCAMLIATRVKAKILMDSGMCGVVDIDSILTAAEWLEEASSEKFDSDDLMDGLAERMEG